MSQTQYNSLISNRLRERHTLAKLRAELEKRKEKMCQCCKKFRHLARNYRNKKEGAQETTIPQNKFEVLLSRVMQCEVKEKVIRRQEVVGVEYFKCRQRGHKYRECFLWEKVRKGRVEKKIAHVARPQKAQQKELRRAKKGEAAYMAKPREVQQEEQRRSSVHILQQKTQEHCGEGIPNKACLLELGWYTEEIIVTYVEYERCGLKEYHVGENRGQEVISNKER